MKFSVYLVLLLAVLVVGASAIDMWVESVSLPTATDTTVTTRPLYGYIDSVHVSCTSTGKVDMKITAGNDLILTSSVTKSVTFRPRVAIDQTNGTVIATATNERIMLVNEKATITLLENAGLTNTWTIKIKLDDKK